MKELQKQLDVLLESSGADADTIKSLKERVYFRLAQKAESCLIYYRSKRLHMQSI